MERKLKKIKENIFNGVKDYMTTSDYVWRREIPTNKDYKIWRLAMMSLTQDRILPKRIRKWLRKSHNNETWSYDEKNEKLIAQIKKYYWIFGKIHTSERRSKEDKFIFCETKSSYTGETVPTTVYWQGYSPHIVFMQGFTKAENSYFTQTKENNLVINDKYINIDNYENRIQFNEAAQKVRIRVVSDASYAYT